MVEHSPSGMSPEGARLSEEYRRSKRRTFWLNAILIACVVLFLLFAVYVLATIKEAREASAERDRAISLIQSDLKTVCDQSKRVALAEKGKQLCARAERDQLPPEVEIIQGQEGPRGSQGPVGPPGEQGPRGPEGPRGKQGPAPTQAQISAAVLRYCAGQPGGSCEGPGPTEAEVRKAVTSYCAARDDCRGPTGPRGPGPTDEQIAEAVDAYCAQRTQCQGPQGKPGTDGEDGDRGPRGYFIVAAEIRGSTSEDNCRLVFTMNDDEEDPTTHVVPIPREFCRGNE